jgi:hypothetical protein
MPSETLRRRAQRPRDSVNNKMQAILIVLKNESCFDTTLQNLEAVFDKVLYNPYDERTGGRTELLALGFIAYRTSLNSPGIYSITPEGSSVLSEMYDFYPDSSANVQKVTEDALEDVKKREDYRFAYLRA